MSIHPDPADFAARPAGASPEVAGAPQPLAHDDTRHDGWTARRQAQFLRELAATQSVTRAARAAGMSRQSAYKLRARLAGEPFDAAWDAAFACSFDALAHAAMERAIHGVEVPHYHAGELVGTHRRFDERLTLGLLAMRADLSPRQGWRMVGEVDVPCDDFAAMVQLVADGAEDWDSAAAIAAERYDVEDSADEDSVPGEPSQPGGEVCEPGDDAQADHHDHDDPGHDDDYDDECDALYDPDAAMAALRAEGIVPPASEDSEQPPTPGAPVSAASAVPPAPSPAPPPAGAAPAYYLADPTQAAAPEAVARHPDDPARRGPSVRLL